jgi:hypothetical protein
MARSLEQQWSTIRPRDPMQARRLEKARLIAIRRVLALDDQIRRLTDAWSGTARWVASWHVHRAHAKLTICRSS